MLRLCYLYVAGATIGYHKIQNISIIASITAESSMDMLTSKLDIKNPEEAQ